MHGYGTSTVVTVPAMIIGCNVIHVNVFLAISISLVAECRGSYLSAFSALCVREGSLVDEHK